MLCVRHCSRHRAKKRLVFRKLPPLTRDGVYTGQWLPWGLMDASSQLTFLHVQAHVFHVPDHLCGCHSHPTEKAAGGQGLVGNNLDARHFSRLLFQNVNTLSHFRTRAPAKTLNKLHKHLWGGWSCHITASAWGCGGGGGLKDSVRCSA